MAEAVSGGEPKAVKPPPKRRRILDPSAIVPVPVYSSKVSSSLQLKPTAALFSENTAAEADAPLWPTVSSQRKMASTVTLSDSEDEPEHVQNRTMLEGSPSPPPPQSPVHRQSRKVQQKLSEIDRKLQAVNSLLSPEPQNTRSRRRRGITVLPPNEDVVITSPDDDDVVIVSPNDDDVIWSPGTGSLSSEYGSLEREIPLKVRCRTDVHKIMVLSSTPLCDVLTQLSFILNVPPPRLLLLREEVELPTDATVGELSLSIADIIECVVMAAENLNEGGGGDIITVRLQSKDRNSSQEFSLHRDAPLGPIFSQFLSKMAASAHRDVRFLFDGCRVVASQTPAQLDMEDGDIIEAWT